MGEREQIINFLLQAADQKNKVIEQLQKDVAELQKKIAELQPGQGADGPSAPVVG